MSEGGPLRVSSAELVRRFGSWQDRAAVDPVFVTHHGRPRLVLLSAGRYHELIGHDGAEPAGDGAARLAALVETIDAGFVAFDAALRILTMNRAAATYFRQRYQPGSIRAIGEDLPDLDRGLVRTHLARTLSRGAGTVLEAASIAYPGEWLRLHCFPYGAGVGLLFRNVSSERAARRYEAMWLGINAAEARHGGVGSGFINPRGLIVQAGAGLESLVGTAPGGLEQQRLVGLFTPEHGAAVMAAIDTALGDGMTSVFEAMLQARGQRVRVAMGAMRGQQGIEGASLIATRIE